MSEKRQNESDKEVNGVKVRGKGTIQHEQSCSVATYPVETWQGRRPPTSCTVLNGDSCSCTDCSRNSLGKLVLCFISTGWGDLSLGVLVVQLHELGEIELGLLKDLDLLDEDVLKWEDLGALLGDGLANGVISAAKKYN